MLSDKIINSLVLNGVVNSKDKELYIYGLHQGFLMILNLIVTIIIGLIFGMVLESIVFMISYIPVRIYAGGYHSKTQLRCFIFSINMIIIVLLSMKLINWTSFLYSIFEIISVVIIFKLAPIEDSNKPLEPIEVSLYKKRARVILLIETSLLFILKTLNFYQISLCILTAHMALSVMLVLGKIKNNKQLIRKSQIDNL